MQVLVARFKESFRVRLETFGTRYFFNKIFFSERFDLLLQRNECNLCNRNPSYLLGNWFL